MNRVNEYSIRDVLKILLQDKSTKQNIIWATDAYESYGQRFSDKNQISVNSLIGDGSVPLKPRTEKSMEEQVNRTRQKAEVFTPVWLCNQMNNNIDELWFGRRDVFNRECDGHHWDVTDARIEFPDGKTWKAYVDLRVLEITCGEAPFLVSRYDTATGNEISVFRRIGLLDRKLRVINENAVDKAEWITWAMRALQASYGYEYQGDSLIIARINIFLTFYDYYKERWGDEPDVKLLRNAANVIAWNIWQMDGLHNVVPLGKPREENHQMTLFEWLSPDEDEDVDFAQPCRIYNWRSDRSILFSDLGDNMSKKLFNFVCGNPPLSIKRRLCNPFSFSSPSHCFC